MGNARREFSIGHFLVKGQDLKFFEFPLSHDVLASSLNYAVLVVGELFSGSLP